MFLRDNFNKPVFFPWPFLSNLYSVAKIPENLESMEKLNNLEIFDIIAEKNSGSV